MQLFTGGHLTFYMPGRKNFLELRLDRQVSLVEILTQLQIPLAEVHLVAVNGEQAELTSTLVNDTDVVRIFSTVDGG